MEKERDVEKKSLQSIKHNFMNIEHFFVSQSKPANGF